MILDGVCYLVIDFCRVILYVWRSPFVVSLFLALSTLPSGEGVLTAHCTEGVTRSAGWEGATGDENGNRNGNGDRAETEAWAETRERKQDENGDGSGNGSGYGNGSGDGSGHGNGSANERTNARPYQEREWGRKQRQ